MLYLKDTVLPLDISRHPRTFLNGGPWNGGDDGGDTLFVLSEGNKTYTADFGIDGAEVNYEMSQVEVQRKFSGGYVINTPSGTANLYDFEYVYLKDAVIKLDSSRHGRTFLYGGPWNGNDDAQNTLFIYKGGNLKYDAGDVTPSAAPVPMRAGGLVRPLSIAGGLPGACAPGEPNAVCRRCTRFGAVLPIPLPLVKMRRAQYSRIHP